MLDYANARFALSNGLADDSGGGSASHPAHAKGRHLQNGAGPCCNILRFEVARFAVLALFARSVRFVRYLALLLALALPLRGLLLDLGGQLGAYGGGAAQEVALGDRGLAVGERLDAG